MNLKIYSVVSNTDLTEGRGWPVFLHHCLLKTSAERLAKKQGVMGSNAEIREFEAVHKDGHYWAPAYIYEGSDEDKASEKKRLAKEAAIERAKSLGLSDDEIKALNH